MYLFMNVYCIYTCITLFLLVCVVYMFSTLSAFCKLMSASQSSGFWLLHSQSRHMSVYFSPFTIHTHDGNLHPLEHLQDINSKRASGAGEPVIQSIVRNCWSWSDPNSQPCPSFWIWNVRACLKASSSYSCLIIYSQCLLCLAVLVWW